MKKIKNKNGLEENFVKKFVETVMDILGTYSTLQNRIGPVGLNLRFLENMVWEIRIPISFGLVSILPFIPDHMQASCGEKYRKELDAVKDEFGDEMKQWIENLEKHFNGENEFVFLLDMKETTEEKAKFSLQLLFSSPDYNAEIRNPEEEALGDNSPFIELENDEEKMRDFLYDYLETWALAPEAWRTARDRRIEYFAVLATNHMLLHGMHWNNYKTFIPKKCFASLLWISSHAFLESITNAAVGDECAKITGTIYAPGKSAAFIVKFEICEAGKGMKIYAFMPVAYDPFHYMHFSKLLAQAEEREPVFEMAVPEEEFANEFEMHAKEAGEKVAKAYGVCVSENDD